MSDPANSITFSTPVTGAEDPTQEAVDNLQGATSSLPSERPQGLPENFKTVDDLVKSYKTLQGELTKTKQEPSETAPAQEVLENSPQVPDVAEVTSLDVQAILVEFNDNEGQLAPERYEEIRKVYGNVPKEMIDNYISMHHQETLRIKDSVLQDIGGQETFDRMASFARENFTKEQWTAYDAAVGSNDYNQALQAVRSLKMAYEQKHGRQPTYVGGAPASAAPQGYSHDDEFLADMRDPRYSSSEHYRQQVHAKIAASQRR